MRIPACPCTGHFARRIVLMKKIAVTMKEAAAISSISRTKLYEAIKNGELKTKMNGTSRILTVENLEHYVESLPEGT